MNIHRTDLIKHEYKDASMGSSKKKRELSESENVSHRSKKHKRRKEATGTDVESVCNMPSVQHSSKKHKKEKKHTKNHSKTVSDDESKNHNHNSKKNGLETLSESNVSPHWTTSYSKNMPHQNNSVLSPQTTRLSDDEVYTNDHANVVKEKPLLGSISMSVIKKDKNKMCKAGDDPKSIGCGNTPLSKKDKKKKCKDEDSLEILSESNVSPHWATSHSKNTLQQNNSLLSPQTTHLSDDEVYTNDRANVVKEKPLLGTKSMSVIKNNKKKMRKNGDDPKTIGCGNSPLSKKDKKKKCKGKDSLEILSESNVSSQWTTSYSKNTLQQNNSVLSPQTTHLSDDEVDTNDRANEVQEKPLLGRKSMSAIKKNKKKMCKDEDDPKSVGCANSPLLKKDKKKKCKDEDGLEILSESNVSPHWTTSHSKNTPRKKNSVLSPQTIQWTDDEVYTNCHANVIKEKLLLGSKSMSVMGRESSIKKDKARDDPKSIGCGKALSSKKDKQKKCKDEDSLESVLHYKEKTNSQKKKHKKKKKEISESEVGGGGGASSSKYVKYNGGFTFHDPVSTLKNDSATEECSELALLHIEESKAEEEGSVCLDHGKRGRQKTHSSTKKKTTKNLQTPKRKSSKTKKVLNPHSTTNFNFEDDSADDNELDEHEIEMFAHDTEPAELNYQPSPLHVIHSTKVLTIADKENLEAQGIKIRTGKWSNKEDAILMDNWKEFAEEYNICSPLLLLGIGTKSSNKLKRFAHAKKLFIRLGKGLEDRTLHSIYQRARKILHPHYKPGSLTPEEEEQLEELLAKYGTDYAKIATCMKKSLTFIYECINWRSKQHASGSWTEEEDLQLVDAIKRVMQCDDVREIHRGIPWKKVSESLKRTSSQCRHRWLTHLCWKADDTKGERRKWNTSDSIKLITLLYESQYEEYSDIDWEEVSSHFDNSASYAYVIKRWHALKTKVPNHHSQDFEDTIQHLYHNYLPELLRKQKKESKAPKVKQEII